MRILVAVLVVGVIAFGAVWWFTGNRSARDSAVQPALNPSVASGSGATPGYVQRDKGEGGVEIEVTYVTPEYMRSGGKDAQRYEPDKYAVFLVSMNTHSVDLSGYDMVKISELRAGGKTLAPLRWVSTSDDSHHRAGALIFPKVALAQAVELVIKTVAGVPARTFRWTP